MEKRFETAIRNKFRFPYKGQIGVEELWDLNLQNLDAIYKTLKVEEKQNAEDSLLSTKSSEDTILETKLDIIRYIASVKLSEAEQKKRAVEIAAERRRINEIIASKRDAALEGLSIEELEKKLAELQ